MFSIVEEVEVKKDSEGLSFTSERAFGDFVYQYLKVNKVATTADIISHVSQNYDLLEGDLVKTSENRSSLRYRQTIDNLIKCHGSILRMYGDLKDFPGGIALQGTVISEEMLNRAKSEMSSRSHKSLEEKARQEELARQEAEKSKERFDNLVKAKSNAKEWRVEILNVVKSNSDLDVKEVVEDFDDIVEDLAYRYPEVITNKESFIKTFISEC